MDYTAEKVGGGAGAGDRWKCWHNKACVHLNVFIKYYSGMSGYSVMLTYHEVIF